PIYSCCGTRKATSASTIFEIVGHAGHIPIAGPVRRPNVMRSTDMTTGAISTALPRSLKSLKAAPIWIQENPLRNLPENSRSSDAAAVLDFPSAKLSPLTCSPASAVRRQALLVQGMAAEIVQSAGEERIDSYIRSPKHTLIAYESGSRRDGLSVIDGLPPSS